MDKAALRLFGAALLVLPLLSGCGEPETVPVAMGSVTSSLVSTGTLQFVTNLKVGFPEGGRIAAINVKVGDRVVPGQPLAQVDDTEQRMALRKAQDQAKIEKLLLDKIIAGNQADAADDDAKSAKSQLAIARRQAEETIEAEKSAIDRLETELRFDRRQLQRQLNQLAEDRECLDDLNVPPGPTDDCIDRVNRREDAVESARKAIIDDKAAIDAAENRLDIVRQSQAAAIESSRQARDSAENAADLEDTNRPIAIEVQRLVLDKANADVERAQVAVKDTIRPSSYSGIVDRINGQVGQVMTASFGTPVRGASGPPGDSLIELRDVNAYQVVVPFSAADGARITPDQSVEVTFDEIPGLVSQARIAAIETPGTAGANPANTIVTAVLTQSDPRLKDGLAARVAVAVSTIDNVLVAPRSAVRVNGRTGMVALEQPDGSRRETSIEIGAVGDTTIQILSGLQVSDRVVVNHAD